MEMTFLLECDSAMISVISIYYFYVKGIGKSTLICLFIKKLNVGQILHYKNNSFHGCAPLLCHSVLL